MFSPWQYNVDRPARRLVANTGWHAPRDDILSVGEFVDHYLVPLAEIFRRSRQLELGARVVDVSRLAHDKVKTVKREQAAFLLQVRTARA